MEWKGVLAAITTPFKADYAVDHAFLAEHAKWQIDQGVDGIVALGSLGEAATLAFDEKVAMIAMKQTTPASAWILGLMVYRSRNAATARVMAIAPAAMRSGRSDSSGAGVSGGVPTIDM